MDQRAERQPVAAAGRAHLALDFFRGQKIVGVEVLDEIALREPERGVPRGGGPTLRLDHDPAARGLKAARDGEALIGRAVIDQDDLHVRPGLVQDGTERGGQPGRGVMAGNQDRDEGGGHP